MKVLRVSEFNKLSRYEQSLFYSKPENHLIEDRVWAKRRNKIIGWALYFSFCGIISYFTDLDFVMGIAITTMTIFAILLLCIPIFFAGDRFAK